MLARQMCQTLRIDFPVAVNGEQRQNCLAEILFPVVLAV